MIVLAVVVGFDTPPGRTKDTEQVVAETEESVAHIKGVSSIGTGFLIRRGLLVTNSHVIQEEFVQNLRVSFPSSGQAGQIHVQLVYEDAQRDIAFLTVPTQRPALRLAEDDDFIKGKDVVIIGNPSVGQVLQLHNAVTRGVLSSETTIEGMPYFQLSASVNPGNSGSPVLDSRAKVLGMVTSRATAAEGLSFCIPSEDLRVALQKFDSSTAEQRLLARSRHRAVATFVIIRTSSELYITCLVGLMTGMSESLKQGGTADEGIVLAREVMRDALNGSQIAAYDHAEDLTPTVVKVITDERLSPSLRDLLLDLWVSYVEIKAHFDTPSGNAIDYADTAGDLASKNRAVAKTLAVLLAVDE